MVVDGSTDGSAELLQGMAKEDPQLRVIVLPENGGKGSAVLAGMAEAAALGFTHALIPAANAPKTAIPGLTVIAVRRLDEAVDRAFALT